jgi:PhnB protein
MRTSLHLTFGGNCEEAFTFYAQTLDGKIGPMLRYGKSPEATKTSPEWLDKIVHGSMTIGHTTLQGADVVPEHYEKPQGFSVLLDVDDAATAERCFRALATGGAVRMPLQKTFWSPAFGVLVDRFGIPWEVNCASAP